MGLCLSLKVPSKTIAVIEQTVLSCRERTNETKSDERFRPEGNGCPQKTGPCQSAAHRSSNSSFPILIEVRSFLFKSEAPGIEGSMLKYCPIA